MTTKRIKHSLRILAVFMGLAFLGSQAAQAGPGEGTLFGTDGTGENLITVDVTDGLGTVVGSTTIDLQALAVDPVGASMFGGEADGFPWIHEINSGTGAVITSKNTGLGDASITGLDFGPDGKLYGAVDLVDDITGPGGADHLVTIDTTTGAATLVGSFGTCAGPVVVPATAVDRQLNLCDVDGIQAIAFDAAGNLFGAQIDTAFAGFPAATLFSIDTSLGVDQASPVGDIIDSNLSATPDGGISSLQFDCEGTLYGGTAGGSILGAEGNLAVIDTVPSGGIVDSFFVNNPVLPTSATSGTDLSGLAFDTACDGGGGDDPIEVIVDISPGPNTASWKCKQSNKQLTVAIESTVDFDATEIDADTVRFGREDAETLAAERHQHKGAAKRHEQDVNGDQLTDLVFHFLLNDTDFSCEDIPGGDSSVIVTGTITGLLTDGETEFVGTDDFEIRK